jgi:hypothetical protein
MVEGMEGLLLVGKACKSSRVEWTATACIVAQADVARLLGAGSPVMPQGAALYEQYTTHVLLHGRLELLLYEANSAGRQPGILDGVLVTSCT